MHGSGDVARVRGQIRIARQVRDLRLAEVRAAHELGVALEQADGQVLAAGQPDADVVADGADEARDLLDREGVRELLLHRLHEELLAGDPVDVGVGVPVADEAERRTARQPLIARLDVDLRVAVRAALVVEVAAIDVDPDAAEDVHDLLEAAEVDRDQVVDRQVRERLDGGEAAERAAPRVGGVDLVRVRRDARAVDLGFQIAWKGELCDGPGRRIGSQQHHRVRARRQAAFAGAVVVAEHERDRRAVRRDDVEVLVDQVDVRTALELEGSHALVDPEVDAATMSSTTPIHANARPTRRNVVFGGGGSTVYSVIGESASGGSVALPEPFPSKAVRPCPRLSVVRTRAREKRRLRREPGRDEPGYPSRPEVPARCGRPPPP